MTAPGRKFLNVTGILIIIFSAFAVLFSISQLFSIDSWIVDWNGSRLAWQIEYTIFAFIGFYGAFVGIMGVSNQYNVEKASLLRVLAIINIVLLAFFRFVLTDILGTTSATADDLNIVYVLLGLLLLAVENGVLALYLIGAVKNKRAFNAQNNEQNYAAENFKD